jgi:hypothetical protein
MRYGNFSSITVLNVKIFRLKYLLVVVPGAMCMAPNTDVLVDNIDFCPVNLVMIYL